MRPNRLFFKYLNYPLYIPEPNRGILVALADRGVSGMLSELERLSTLGSAWASSTLGYLSLLPSSCGDRDPKRAIEICSNAAADGDPYALYVIGWARFILTQDAVKAAEAMMQSSRRRFVPATLAMAFFVGKNTEMALRFLDVAAKGGHKAAWTFRCGFLKTGRMGAIRKIAGHVQAPFARLRYAIAIWLNPFSENVVFFALTDHRPVYRSIIGNTR